MVRNRFEWMTHPVALSAFSGCVWALILALLMGERVFGSAIWGGLVASPLIGVLVGRLFSTLGERSAGVQIVGSLISLYLAAICFALAMAVTTLPAPVLGYVLATLWGLTFGYVVIFWPLAFLNHRLIWRVSARDSGSGDRTRLSRPTKHSRADDPLHSSAEPYLLQGRLHRHRPCDPMGVDPRRE